MSEEIKTTDNTVDETKLLDSLKKKADLLGIKYNPKIGLDKLKLKVDLFLEEQSGNEIETTTTVGPNNTIAKLEAKAKRPVRVIINDLDSSTQNEPTITMHIGNKYFKVGAIILKEQEQDVPYAIVEAIKAKTMIKWVAQNHAITKRPTGNKVAKTTARYNITIIDKDPSGLLK